MMTTAEGGLAYQRWLATINQVCGHFAARPLKESFHGEMTPATPAASRSVPSPPPASISTARAMR